MRILLVHAAMMRNGRVEKRRRVLSPSLTLAYLAALFPSHYEIVLVDDTVQEVPFEEHFDLVGITFYGPAAYRAFEIARRFRERRIPVVFGGPTVTLTPVPFRSHCDSLVIGEAEEVMPRLLDDLQSGKLAPVYQANGPANVVGLPVPRYDLLDRSRYQGVYPVQSARGCVFRCSFCSIPVYNRYTARYRPVEEVVRDVETAVRCSGRREIFFVDDHINMNPVRAAELFRALIPLRIQWMSFASTLIAEQPEALRLAAESGSRLLFLGFESLNDGALVGANKHFNRPDDYREAIATIHAHGIHLIAAFLPGLDGDGPDVFRKIREFVETNRISVPTFNLVNPVPGTPFFEQLRREGRIIGNDMSVLDQLHVIVRPEGMSPEQLDEGFRWLRKTTYSIPSILRRTVFRKPVGGWRRWRMQLRMVAVNLWRRAEFRALDRERPRFSSRTHGENAETQHGQP